MKTTMKQSEKQPSAGAWATREAKCHVIRDNWAETI